MTRLRVAVIANMLEERWPSMDLVADMLVQHLQSEHRDQIEPTLIRPAMRRRASRLPLAGGIPQAFTFDRFTNRLWDYPRLTRAAAARFDVFHVVDHSYAQLVHTLPARRTLVTCHDLDTFRSILEPDLEPRSALFRLMTRRIFAGLCKAGHIACDTEATRDALVTKAGVDPACTSVVLNGPHPSCSPEAEPAADVEAARLLGPAGRTTDLLHVGSTIARKRIDVLLQVVAAVRRQCPDLRLVRVGGPFTAEQRGLVRDLGIEDAIVVLPFLDRSTLAAVYRRTALVLLPSEREGFGLPVLEALACGTPIIASDIEALREVGGSAVEYCAPEDLEGWTGAVLRRLTERRDDPAGWARRRQVGIERAASFSWSRYTGDIVALYQRLAASAPRITRA
ncbi:MAG: glycosyltransferase family 1 protein [Acidobacteriota bacterium]